ETVYFTPDAALSPSTGYTVEIHYCNGMPSIGFTTSSLGTSVDDISALVGSTYELDLGSARFVEPEGVGTILSTQIEQSLLLGV
ncbi:MAG: hypothetical protein QGG40_07450, partial [Myxococcota bacterium]|nr:hypothetical protein [Myxococcota bacterium]